MPKFNKFGRNYGNNDGFERRVLVNNTFNRKKRQPFISPRAFEAIRDSGRSSAVDSLLKVICHTSSTDCFQDLLRAIEDTISRNGGSRLKLKAKNPLYRNNDLEFFIRIPRGDQKILRRCASLVDRYSIKVMDYTDIHYPPQFPDHWVEKIKEALSLRFKKFDDGRTCLDLSRFHQDKIFEECGLELRLNRPKVMDNVLEVLKGQLHELSELNISENDIDRPFLLRSFFNDVKVFKLDLSKNKVRDVENLTFLADSGIQELSLEGNDIMRKYYSRSVLRDKINNILPGLQVLNGQPLDDVVVIAADRAKSMKRLPTTLPASRDTDVYRFVIEFFGKFDAKNRDSLCDLYSSESVLTLDACGDLPLFYKTASRNLRHYKDRSGARIKRGKAEIVGFFAGFPATHHLLDSLNVDVIGSGDRFMFCQVTGVFIELPKNNSEQCRARRFSRFLVIVEGPVVLQDNLSMNLHEEKSYQSAYKSSIARVRDLLTFCKGCPALDKMSLADVEIVRQFSEFSGMPATGSLQFLSQCSSLDEARDRFQKQRSECPLMNG